MSKSEKIALITGITGQAGAYLAELLLKKGYNVVGVKRRSSLNVGSGVDLTSRELAKTIAKVVRYQCKFVQDTSKPNGTMRKVMDVTKIRSLGWKPKFELQSGILRAYEGYLSGSTL